MDYNPALNYRPDPGSKRAKKQGCNCRKDVIMSKCPVHGYLTETLHGTPQPVTFISRVKRIFKF